MTNLSPDDEESLVRRAARAGMSGLGMVGNLLDLPGSMVRDALAFQNPLDQLLSPLSDQNRTSGRQLLENLGMRPNRETGMGGWLSDPGEGARDVAGFAADVLLDPLTYLTGPFAIGGRGAKALKAAGLLDDVAKTASRTLGRAVGPREARLVTKVGDVMDAASPAAQTTAREFAQRAGYDLADHLADPLAGATTFKPTGAILGTGAASQKLAGFMDRWSPNPFDAGSVYRNTTAGRAIGGLLDATRQGKMGAAIPYAQAAFRGVTDAQAETKGVVTELANTLHKLGATDSESAKALRAAIEGVPGGQDYGGVAAQMREIYDRHLQELRDLGAPAHELEDVADYAFRQLNLPKRSGGSAPLVGRVPADVGRQDVLKGFRGGTTGTHGLEEILTNPAIDSRIKLLQSIPTTAGNAAEMRREIQNNIEGVLRTQYADDIVPTYHERDAKGHFKFEDGVTKTRAQLAQGSWSPDRSHWVKTNAAGEITETLTPVMKDRYKEFARYLIDHPDFRESGMFTNHPLTDFGVMSDIVGRKKAVFGQAYEFLKDHAKPGDSGPTAGDVLDKVGLSTDRAMENLASKIGVQLSGDAAERATQLAAIKDLRIPKEAYDDFMREAPRLQFTPALEPLVKFADSASNLFKASVLSWPATKVRDLVSGLFQSAQEGRMSPADIGKMDAIFKGHAVSGLTENPMVAKWLTERRLPHTDENASEAMRLLLAKHMPGRVNPHLDLADTLHEASDAPNYAGGIDQILDLIPGLKKQGEVEYIKELIGKGVPRLQGQASLNPLSKEFWTQFGTVRGVGGATESTLGPVAAAEMAGKRTDFMNRAVPFANLTGKGFDPSEAIRQVNFAQVNYDPRTFTPAERVLKMLFPFYSFSSRQIPYVGKTLTTNPGGGMGQTIRAIKAGRDDDAMLPEHIADTAAIPLPAKVSDGTKRYLTGVGLMMEDPLQFFAGPRSAGLEVLSRLNPAIKGPLEWATGQSFFQKGPNGGRPLDDLDPTLGRILANVTGQEQVVKTPQALEAIIGNSPLTRVATTLRQLTDTRKDWKDKAAALGTGLRVSDVSPAAQDAMLREWVQDAEKKIGGRTFLKTWIPDDVKAKMSPEQLANALKLEALMNVLNKRTKDRRESTGKR